MKLKRLTWIAVVLLILAVGLVLLLGFSPEGLKSDQTGEISIDQAIARTGDLTISVSGSGELVAVSETQLSFGEKGELVALNVGVGDQVTAGDVLAILQLDRTEAEHMAVLAKAELDVQTARQRIDQLNQNAQLEAAEALLAYEQAQLVYESLQDYELEQALALQELRLVEEAVQAAEMDLYIINSEPSQQTLQTAYASLLFKQKELQEIKVQISQAEFQFKSAPNQMVRDRLDQQLKDLRLQLANQQLEYENTLYKYETLGDPPEATTLFLAEARLATAQEQLAEAKADWAEAQQGPLEGDLAMAAARLGEAESRWEGLRDGPDPQEMAILEAHLETAELKLQALRDETLILELVAPTDGIILRINTEVGDRVGDGTILTLADLSQKMLAVSLDETDQSSVQVGNRVEISFDAIPGRMFTGEVVQIEPSLINIGNSRAFRLSVVLEEQPNTLINLPLGVNAAVDVITGEVQNAVLVSLEALHEETGAGYSVYVIQGENLAQRLVQVGLKDATTAEIVSGIQPGEAVAIGDVNLDQE